MKYERFATLDEMTAFAVAHAKTSDTLVYVDYGIYTDDNGLTYRPHVMLVQDGHETISLRWNAFCDQDDVSHIGKRMRREANEAASKFADTVQEAINTALRTPTEGAKTETKHRAGDIRVCDATEYDYAEGYVIEMYGIWSGQEMWAIPAWEESGYSSLSGVFATREAAQAAIDNL